MSDTERQLSDALTAQFVAIRTAVEALLNRVTAMVTAEQLERLKLQEQIDGLRGDVRELRALLEERQS